MKIEPEIKTEILSSLKAKDILRHMTNGLAYLHRNNIVSRNGKPSNYLIKEINTHPSKKQYIVVITDFRLARKWDPSKLDDLSGSAASEGWEAPESRKKGAELKKSLDVFILGCLYNYVLTGMETEEALPKHPFGDGERERIQNMGDGQQVANNLFQPETEDKAICHLIQSMISKEEGNRPTLEDVLKNPYFQPSEDYNIYGYPKPGLCVIFNQQKFDPSTKVSPFICKKVKVQH